MAGRKADSIIKKISLKDFVANHKEYKKNKKNETNSSIKTIENSSSNSVESTENKNMEHNLNINELKSFKEEIKPKAIQSQMKEEKKLKENINTLWENNNILWKDTDISQKNTSILLENRLNNQKDNTTLIETKKNEIEKNGIPWTDLFSNYESNFTENKIDKTKNSNKKIKKITTLITVTIFICSSGLIYINLDKNLQGNILEHQDKIEDPKETNESEKTQKVKEIEEINEIENTEKINEVEEINEIEEVNVLWNIMKIEKIKNSKDIKYKFDWKLFDNRKLIDNEIKNIINTDGTNKIRNYIISRYKKKNNIN